MSDVLTPTRQIRLKRAALIAGAVVLFGAGYRFSSGRFERQLAAEKLRNAQNLTQKMTEAYQKGWKNGRESLDFNLTDYLPSGLRRADVEAIEAQPFINPDSVKYAGQKMDSLTAAELKSADSLKDKKGQPLIKKWTIEHLQVEKHRLRQKNPTNAEELLAENKAYRDLLRLEMRKCSRYGENIGFLKLSSAELKKTVLLSTEKMKFKMGLMEKYKNPGHYPINQFLQDYHRIRMAGAVLEERRLRESHNKLVDTLIMARIPEHKAAFAALKKQQVKALEDSLSERRRLEVDSFIHPFKYQQPLPAFAPVQKGIAARASGR